MTNADHYEDDITRSADGHYCDGLAAYEANHATQRCPMHVKSTPFESAPNITVLHNSGNKINSTGVANKSFPISPQLQSKPPSKLSRPITPSSDTCKQVRQTILKLIRELVLDASPSLNLLGSCVNACHTYRLDFSRILRKKYIGDHSVIYWATLKGDGSFLRSLLAHASPLSRTTKSEMYRACLATRDQRLFNSLRCWRASLGQTATPLSLCTVADKFVLGSTPADEVAIIEIHDQGKFVANMQINLWQKRLRIAGTVTVEFIALGRIWCLEFFTPSSSEVVGLWKASISLLEHSPPTFVNARLVIDLPPSNSSSAAANTSQTADLISFSLSPDDSNGPATRNLPTSDKSKSKPKAEQSIEIQFKSRHRLAYDSEYERWTDEDGHTCTNAIGVSLDDGASAELTKEHTPFVASDGTLYARLEARLESRPRKRSLKVK